MNISQSDSYIWTNITIIHIDHNIFCCFFTYSKPIRIPKYKGVINVALTTEAVNPLNRTDKDLFYCKYFIIDMYDLNNWGLCWLFNWKIFLYLNTYVLQSVQWVHQCHSKNWQSCWRSYGFKQRVALRVLFNNSGKGTVEIEMDESNKIAEPVAIVECSSHLWPSPPELSHKCICLQLMIGHGPLYPVCVHWVDNSGCDQRWVQGEENRIAYEF